MTGTRAACTTEDATEPSSMPANPPRPWLGPLHDAGHRHVGIALLPAGQALAEDLGTALLEHVPVGPGQLDEVPVADRVDGDQVDRTPGSLVERDRDRRLRGP